MGESTFDGHELLVRLCNLPGGRELLDLACGHDDVELVGGAVRDLMLGRDPRELDVVVGGRESFPGAASAFAGELATRLGAVSVREHERFGTTSVAWDGGRIDIATRRAESYPAPGALPDVRAGTPEEDLRRRDFTVNAIAVTLDTTRPGEVRAPPGALDDLRTGRLRVLHDASFIDDPTRLLRLARYAARLSFTVEPHTAELATQAVTSRALETISGARIGAELRLALAEPDMPGAFVAIDDLGLLAALHPRVRLERATLQRALELLPDDGRRDLLAMAAVTLPLLPRGGDDPPDSEILALLDRLEFPAPDRDTIAAAALAAPRLAEELAPDTRPSRLRALVASTPSEGIALAGALSPSAAEPARRWLAELRDIHLSITGEDLLAAGIPEGPEIGRRLEAVLGLRLDDELAAGHDSELAAAMEARP